MKFTMPNLLLISFVFFSMSGYAQQQCMTPNDCIPCSNGQPPNCINNLCSCPSLSIGNFVGGTPIEGGSVDINKRTTINREATKSKSTNVIVDGKKKEIKPTERSHEERPEGRNVKR